MAFKRTDWNALIDQVNALITSNSLPATPLVEVEKGHVWKKDDVTVLRSKLTEICTNHPTFAVPLNKWSQKLMSELTAATSGCQCTADVYLYNASYSNGSIVLEGLRSTMTALTHKTDGTNTVYGYVYTQKYISYRTYSTWKFVVSAEFHGGWGYDSSSKTYTLPVLTLTTILGSGSSLNINYGSVTNNSNDQFMLVWSTSKTVLDAYVALHYA